MAIYLILPEYKVYQKYKWYFQKVFDFATSNRKYAFIFSAQEDSDYKSELQGVKFRPLSIVSKAAEATDIVFDFLGCRDLISRHYFKLTTSTLDCCLYSCLTLENDSTQTHVRTRFPVELLSSRWFEVLHKPDQELFGRNEIDKITKINIDQPSEQRARLSYHSQKVMSECLTSGLEALLLGRDVDFPGQLIGTGSFRDVYLTSKLMPSSVLTNKSVFYEFIENINSEPLIHDAVLELHYQSLAEANTAEKKTDLYRKLRKFKRDPVLFLSDAMKKLFR